MGSTFATLVVSTLLICGTAAAAEQTIGSIDGVFISQFGVASIQGWACSPGSVHSASIRIVVGEESKAGETVLLDVLDSAKDSFPANTANEPSVSMACKDAAFGHRFKIDIPQAFRDEHIGQTISAYSFILPSENPGVLLEQSGKFVIPSANP